MTHDSYDVEYVCRIIELKMGRPANEAERRAIAKLGNPRDRRRLGQLIQNSSEDVDITRIELPPLPENAKESQIVDEELDPVAWRHIANLCGKPGTTARPAIPEAGVPTPAAEFRSVPQQRGQLQAEQQQRHQRISDIAAQRKQKRREEMERRSAPQRTEPPAQPQEPAQITAE